MKKIYLMGLSAMFTLAVTAQTSIRIKTPTVRNKTNQELNTNAKQGGGVNTINQVNGNLVCNTTYTAGSTMNLVFKFTQTGNTDEWIDMFTLTFPTGITPNSSPNATFPTSSASGGAETLNPVAGQDIAWGVDINDGWGGITTTATGVTFTVNVTIGAVSGNQTATFLASGDTYTTAGNPTPGDLNGSAIIYPAGAVIVDMKTKFAQPTTIMAINNCAMGMSPIFARFINSSTSAQSNFSVNYSVNGVASTPTIIAGPLAVDDSIDVTFATPFDFTPSNMYTVNAWVSQVADITLSNDTAGIVISNTIPTALTNTATPYINGIETAYDLGSINKTWAGLGLPFYQSTTTFHTGTAALDYIIPGAAPANTYETYAILPCVDVTSSEIYKISYWKKSSTSGTLTVNGESAVFTGTDQTIAAMTTVLKPYSAITPNAPTGVWTKDSVNFVAAANETRYFAIGGRGIIANASDQINVSIDDITITKLGTVGIKTNSSIEAVSIFPNPTSGILNVTSVEVTSSIEVFNVIGEKVYSSNLVKGNNVVDLSSLSNGAYFVKMNSNNQIITKKVVLSK